MNDGVPDDQRVGELIARIESGDQHATEELLPLVYRELRRLAQHRLTGRGGNQTLQATALVHEAYVRLVDSPNPQAWDSKGHFFSAAAEAMRRILVDRARRKGRQKRGGQHQKVDLSVSQIVDEVPIDDLEALNEALLKFEEAYPDKAQVIKLRFFTGLSEEETANALGISRATASRHWTFGRVWLFKEMSKADAP